MNNQSVITSKNEVQQIGINKAYTSPQLPQNKDATINVRDRANDILETEKHNLVSYQIGINEIIDDDLRNVVINNRNNIQGLQVKLFICLSNLILYGEIFLQ